MKLLLSKKVYFFLFITLLAFSSCKKEYPSIEEEDTLQVDAYIKSKGLTSLTQYKETGVYYEIITPGTGAILDYKDVAYLSYTMSSLDGKYVSNDISRNHYGTFLGYLDGSHGYPDVWGLIVKEILQRKGGSIRIIVPSRYAYGRNGSGLIPGNASLDCVINLYDVNNVTEFEDIFVRDYLQKKGLTGFTRLSTGEYYQIITPGTGTDIADVNSTIKVAYTGKLAEGIVFDTSTAYINVLASLIKGWQHAIPFITTGGKIRLIVPPAQGYGGSASGSIPGSTILDFEIELLDVIN